MKTNIAFHCFINFYKKLVVNIIYHNRNHFSCNSQTLKQKNKITEATVSFNSEKFEDTKGVFKSSKPKTRRKKTKIQGTKGVFKSSTPKTRRRKDKNKRKKKKKNNGQQNTTQ